jgi:drug/metabolite transporter (DMT)-like permease
MNIAIAYTVCALVWGTTWFAIRVCIGPEGYPTFAAAALRFSLAAAILIPLWLFGFARPGPRFRRQWWWLVLAGVLNAVGYALVYLGEETISGGLAAVLFGTEPLLVALLVTVTRTETVTRGQLAGALTALAGIGVIFWDRLGVSAEQAVGLGLVMAAVCVSSIYVIIVKRHAGDSHPLASTAIFLTVTAVVLWVVALASGWEPLPWPPPRAATVALVYLAVFGSIIAFATYFYLLRRFSVMATMSLTFVIPVIALMVDALWEDEVRLAGRTYLGVAITLLGVFVSLIMRRRDVAH